MRTVRPLILSLLILAASTAQATAATKYTTLSKVGVKAGKASVTGQKLKVTLRLRQRSRVKLEVVSGSRVKARAKAKTFKKGRRTVTVTLNRRPSGLRLKLRVTVKNLVTRKSGRGTIRLKVVTAPGPDPSPTPTPTPTPKPSPTPTPTPAPNRAPTDIALSSASTAEGQPAGTVVGTLAAADLNAGDVHRFTLVAGTGDADNALFTVEGNQLETAAVLDFEQQPTRSVRVRVDDGRGGVFEKSLTITVTDANDAPTAPKLSAQTVPETAPSGTTVGVLTATDQDAGQTLTFSLVSGVGDTDNASFTIDGTALKTATALDFETKSSYTVRIQVSDGGGGSTADQYSIIVTDQTEGPLVTMASAPLQYTENGAPVAVDPELTATTPENANLTGATVRVSAGHGLGDVLVFTNQNGIAGSYNAGSGVLTLTGSAPPATYQQALRTVTYSSTSETPVTSKAIEVVVHLGASSSAPATRALSVAAVNDRPAADADAFGGGQRGVRMRVGSTHADAHEVEVAGNVLEGDTDVDTPVANLTATPGTFTTVDGGTVTISANGTFVYDPPAGDDGSDSFTYTVEDNDTGDSDGTEDTHTNTVTITQAGPRVWFVDDSAAAGGRGVSHAPLQSLAPLTTGGAHDAKDGTGDRIFVYSGTYTGGIELESGQHLLGQPQGLNLNARQLVAAGGTKPAISSAAGNAVTLHSGVNEVRQLALGNTPAASYSLVAPAGAGAFTVADTDIVNGTGGGLNIADGTPTVTLGTLSSTGAGGNAVRITDTEGGAVTVTGGTLSNATGAVLLMSNANTALTLGPAISDDAGPLVSVTGGSSDVTYNGTITDGEDGDGEGIAIASTTGDHNFTKAVTLSTGAAHAMRMSNSPTGSLRMVPTAGTNRLATTAGTALSVTDTPIKAGGLSFERISAVDPAIEAGTFGIHLQNTGSDGNLTVAGTGTAGTGGTIQGKATGIRIDNGRGPSLSWMKLTNHGDFAIKGDTVTGFTMANTVIDGSVGRNGNSSVTDEGAVSFDELLGTGVAITNSVIKEGWENDLRVKNDSGTLNRLTVTGTQFGSSSPEHNDSIQLEGNVNAVLNATVQNNTFNSARGDHLQAVAQDAASGDFQVIGNTVSNAHPTSLGGGLLIAGAGDGNVTYALNNNDIDGAKGSALVAEKLFSQARANTGTVVGTISGNLVGTTTVPGSGSANGAGIFIRGFTRGKHSVVVSNNTVRQYRDHGIAAYAGGAPTSTTLLPAHDAKLNLKLTNNNVAVPNGTGAGTGGGIYIQNGTNTGDQYELCVDATGNTINGSAPLAVGSTDFLMFQRFDTIFRLPAYTGPADNAANTLTASLNSYFHPRFVGGVLALGGNTTTQYLVNTASATGGYFNTTSPATSSPCPTT